MTVCKILTQSNCYVWPCWLCTNRHKHGQLSQFQLQAMTQSLIYQKVHLTVYKNRVWVMSNSLDSNTQVIHHTVNIVNEYKKMPVSCTVHQIWHKVLQIHVESQVYSQLTSQPPSVWYVRKIKHNSQQLQKAYTKSKSFNDIHDREDGNVMPKV
jgi:hypothetical protein